MLPNFDPQTTALVLIDLQQGILGYAKAPRPAESVLVVAAKLAKRYRAIGALVVLVRVGWSHDFADALNQPVDQPAKLPADGLPSTWWNFPEVLEVSDNDLLITKRQWNAFHGTELDLQLRRRGIKTLVLGGISTNIGVESTARAGYELGYTLVLVEDAMSCAAAEQHQASVDYIFPRLGLVRQSEEILQALAG